MRLPVNTVIHTTLVGLEPATFRSLVRRATSSATERTKREVKNKTGRARESAHLCQVILKNFWGHVTLATPPFS